MCAKIIFAAFKTCNKKMAFLFFKCQINKKINYRQQRNNESNFVNYAFSCQKCQNCVKLTFLKSIKVSL